MLNSFSVALLVLINAFLTNAHSYHQSYERNGGQRYPDTSDSYVTNFGNGNNKRNFVNIDETSDRTSIAGSSFANDNSGRPSVQKINVDFNHPNYRGPEGPNVNWNPAATRTQITNIGNGVGNRNLFVFNDRRHDQPNQGNNQEGNNGYRGEPNTGYQGRTRTITNIGKGPDNDNQIFVNNKRVYPNAAQAAGVQNSKATDRLSSVISDVTRYANDFGNGHQNNNRIIINGKEINPNAVSNTLNVPNKRQGYKTVNVNGGQDPSVTPQSLPSANSNGQIEQRQGWTPNDNINRPNGVTRKYGTGHQTPILNGHTKNNYNTHNYNQVKFVNSNFGDVFNDPSLKELPMRA